VKVMEDKWDNLSISQLKDKVDAIPPVFRVQTVGIIGKGTDGQRQGLPHGKGSFVVPKSIYVNSLLTLEHLSNIIIHKLSIIGITPGTRGSRCG